MKISISVEKLAMGYEKNMSFLVISKLNLRKFEKKNEKMGLDSFKATVLSLKPIGAAIFGATFNLVTRVGPP